MSSIRPSLLNLTQALRFLIEGGLLSLMIEGARACYALFDEKPAVFLASDIERLEYGLWNLQKSLRRRKKSQ